MEKCQEKWQKTKLKFGGAGTGEIRGYLGLSHAPHPQVAAPGERSGEAGGEQTPSPNETGSVSPGKGGGGGGKGRGGGGKKRNSNESFKTRDSGTSRWDPGSALSVRGAKTGGGVWAPPSSPNDLFLQFGGL